MKSRGTLGILLLGLVLTSTIACSGGDEDAASQQPADDIGITVFADGKVEATLQMGLTFGSGGRVDRIYVKEGDQVSKGDVLARLDTSTLELAEVQAKAALTQAKVARTTAEIAVIQAQASITQAKAGVTQAKVNLTNAEIALELARTAYSVSDIRAAEAGVDVAQRNFDEALWVFSKYDAGTVGYEKYQEVVLQAEAGLKAVRDTRDAMLSGFDVKEVASKRLQIEVDGQSLELAEQNLEIAGQLISLRRESVEQAVQTVSLAQQSLALARKALQEGTIVAPFDGTVYNVGLKEGEFLSPVTFAGTPVVKIIDLRHLKLTVSVDELDIARVRTGQKVRISVDALPETELEGRITFISLVPGEPVGVVLFEDDDEVESYDVKIDIDVPSDLPIRSGMNATVEIIVEKE